MDLPEELVDRILASIQSRMPDGFTFDKFDPRAVNFRVTPELATATSFHHLAYIWSSQIGARNRDGISPRSIAWATWLVLDSLIHASRSTGLPWAKQVAKGLQAYADSDHQGIRCWVADSRGFRLDFPPIEIGGIAMAPPSGWRLPFPLLKRYRLPREGPITAPGARG
jgi:hypothetical protein